MLRNIKLSVDVVYIDPNSTLKHSGTSYQVSRTPNFDNLSTLIVNVVNSSVDLLSHTFEHNVVVNQPLYVRTRYHFNNGSVSSWSNIIELSGNQVGLKSSSTVVATPEISVSFDYSATVEGELVVKLANIALYSGVGTIVSTSWGIETTDGVVLYTLPESRDVLTELRLPLSVMNGNECIIAYARVHTNTNAASNIARAISVLKSTTVEYFKIAMKGGLYVAATNYLIVSNHAAVYNSIDIRIKAADGTVVVNYTGLDPYTPRYDVGALDINGYYIAEVRATDGAGNPTPWVEYYRGQLANYDIRPYSDTTTYNTTRFNFGGYIDFNGLSAQTVRADSDGVFYLAVPETTRLDAYRSVHGGIYKLGASLDLGAGNLFSIPNINYLSLYDGNYLLDHNLVSSGGEIEVARFTYLEYNSVTKLLTPTTTYTRTDERYGTGRTGSSIVTKNNQVYYVPGEIFDSKGAQLDLEMRVFDIATNTIVDNIPLPVTGLTENVTISEDMNGDIYMFGGTGGPVKSAAHNEESRTLLNKVIYKYNKATRDWVAVYTVKLLNSLSYRYKMQTLRNGTICIIDATPGLVNGGTRSSYIYDSVSNTITGTMTNNPTTEHIGVVIELPDGDVGFMSSTADTVEAISFLRTSTSSMPTDNTIMSESQPVTALVVPIGETVYIRDPYRYASIVIEGTSLSSTGKLVWIRNDIVTEYYYNDLIVTRNMTLPQPAVGSPGPTFNRVVVVGDAILTVL